MPQRPKIANNMLELIGYTPLVRLNRIPETGSAELLAKLSVKDRIGAAMIEDAERQGLISPGKTVLIEPTSGNTGIALAFAAAIKGYKLIAVMPDSTTIERRQVMQALGTELVLTPGADGMRGAFDKTNELLAARTDLWQPGKFENPANP
jgi:cysteine synthase A